MSKRSWLMAIAAVALLSPSCAETPTKDTFAGIKPVVVIDTSLGTMKVELDDAKAPITVKNFLDYVDAKFYDGTLFHRVIPDFMIQGGGYDPRFSKASAAGEVRAAEKETRGPIKNEARNGLHNLRGTIAMARTNNPDSATSQFFINTVDNTDKLDPSPQSAGYCVFGRVIEGMDVVDKVRKVQTKELIPRQITDVPVQDVIIKSIRRADK